MTTGIDGLHFYFDGRTLTTEEIAWIVEEASKIGHAEGGYGFIYQAEDDHILLGVGSRSERYNIQVSPLNPGQMFMEGGCILGIVLTPSYNCWGHHAEDAGRTTHIDYARALLAFRRNIERAFRHAKEIRFPALKLGEAD